MRKTRSSLLAILLLAAATARAQGTAGAAKAPADPNAATVEDLGMSVKKPASWIFIPMAESERARYALVSRSTGDADVAGKVALNSVTVCQINRYPFDASHPGPNPGVTFAIQNLSGMPSIEDAKEFAKQGVPPLKLVYRDIEFEQVLEPVKVGEVAGFKHRFRAKVDPSIYEGVMRVEQHYVLQDRMGICVTYMDTVQGWAKSEPDFAAIQRSVILPAKRPEAKAAKP